MIDVLDIPEFGPCCCCGKDDGTVTNIVMLDRRAPVPDTGWGCLTCGLPSDGAVAVVCQSCLETNAPIRWIVKGDIISHERIAENEFPIMAFNHDMAKHESPTMTSDVPLTSIVPGGIRQSDFLHIETNDGTCSRCRQPISDDDVPLMLWKNDNDLYQFCERCSGVPATERAAHQWVH